MKFSEFIVPEAIVPSLKASDREGVIQELATALGQADAIPLSAVGEIVAAVMKREKNGSTGFGKGVAVPHVKHPLIKKMVGTIGHSAEGIDFAALDHQPVYSVVLLLSPDTDPNRHIQAMEIIFVNLQEDTFRRFLHQSTTREQIIDLLQEADQGE